MVALVTGASKGIGAEIAKQFASEGATVVVNYALSKEGAEKVVSEITSNGGKAVALPGNVAIGAEIERLFAEIKKRFGRLDILVNNAGVYEFLPLEQITESHFHKQFDVNVLGLLLASREAVKHFPPEGGSIVNIGSLASDATPANTAVYSATKAAVDAVTKVLAKELAPRKIRVNAINPGPVETEGTRAVGFTDEAFLRDLAARTPFGRIGQPEDIAPVAVFFASKDSAWITGETLRVAGGLTSAGLRD